MVSENSFGLQRLIFFSDAVFAIAITLLAISIRLPSIPSGSIDLLLNREIINLAPKFAFYALSFLIIGSYWMAHHKMFQFIKRYDDAFIFLNILSLMFIAAVPIPTNILGEYLKYSQALILYAAYMAVTSFFLAAVWFYASFKKRLIEDSAPALYILVRSLISTVIFIISIPIILVNNFGFICWPSILVLQFIWKKIYFRTPGNTKRN